MVRRAVPFLALLLLLNCGGGDAGSPSGPPPEPAPIYGAALQSGVVQSAEVLEASGLTASRQNPGVLWTHNDSGDAGRIFAMTPAGTHLGTYTIPGALATDWEDIGVGPGPVAGVQYLYIADSGDNALGRNSVTVVRVPEPAISPAQAPAVVALAGMATLRMTYPAGARNAEAMLVDPLNGDLYLVTKEGSGSSELYRYPAPQDPQSVYSLQRAGNLTFGSEQLPGSPLVTGGAISPSGALVALRTYSHVFVWQRPAGMTIVAALARSPVARIAHAEPQGEAVAFPADGKGLYTVSEGPHSPIYFIPQLN